MVLVDEGGGTPVIKRGALKMDADGCSCNRHSILVANQLTWKDVKKQPQHRVIAFRVADVRRHGMGVADDPWPSVPEPMPADVAHALVVTAGDLSIRQRKESLSAIARCAWLMAED